MELTPESVEKRLDSGSENDRLDMLDELRDAARTLQDLKYDHLLHILRECGGFGPKSERSAEVRKEIHRTKRAVAIARGRKQGLRVHGLRPGVLDDEKIVWAAIVLVWDAVSIYDGVEIFDASLALATPRQRHFYAFWWTQSEVANGGFHQYFANPTGIVAPTALDGLRALGATAAAKALAEACAPFDMMRITDRHYRDSVLAKLDDNVFDNADTAFTKACPKVFKLAAAYIHDHPSEFFETWPP